MLEKTGRKLFFATSSIAAITVASGLAAGANAQEAAASAEASGGLDQILVTARKRSENLQETPISISAFTGDTLEERQLQSGDDLSRIVPNLVFETNSPASGSNSSAQIFIRGVGQTDFQSLNDPGVGVYVDGVYYARTVGAVLDFLDIERIEVLRGPQGTLFGRNTIGGAINITSVKPTADEFSGYVRGTTGTGDRLDGVVSVNLPLWEDAAIRVSAATFNQDGYITRLNGGDALGDTNADSIRARFFWEPTDNFSVDIIGDYTEEDEAGAPLIFSRINTSAAFVRFGSFDAGCPGQATVNDSVPEVADPRCANNQYTALQPHATAQSFDTFSQLEHWGISGTLELDLGAVTAKSITSYRRLESFAGRDADNTPVQVLHTTFATEDRQFSQELQLLGSLFDDRLNWILGGYYFDQSATDANTVDLPIRTGSTILTGPVDIKSVAVFGQATYDVTDRLSATFGIRYTDEEKRFLPQPQVTSPTLTLALPDAFVTPEYVALLNELAPAGTTPTIIDIPPPVTLAILPQDTFLLRPVESVAEASETTIMANLAYQATDQTLVYATYSEGFKGGGLNFRVIEPEFDPVAFDPEFVDQYEIGVKSDLFDNRLRVNLSAFLTKYNDIQVVVTPVLTPTTINAAKGEAKGFELEFNAAPLDGFLLTGGVGFTDTKYTELDQRAIDFGGLTLDNVFQQTPRWTANIGASYDVDMGDFVFTPGIDYSFRSERFFDAVNTPTMRQDDLSLVNIRAALEYQEMITLSVGVLNLADKVYRTGGFSSFGSAAGYEEIGFSRGREWFFSLKYAF